MVYSAWRTNSSKNVSVEHLSSNDGRPIVITHICDGKNATGLRKLPYLFYLVSKKKGDNGLYFVGNNGLVEQWLKNHGESFYEEEFVRVQERRGIFRKFTEPINAVYDDVLVVWRSGKVRVGKKIRGNLEDMLAVHLTSAEHTKQVIQL
ncbi:MAG: hypothetical protein AABW80_05290 [Nanoarchaeota archaeon]|mgnify:CR=1 FL=1